VISKYTQDFLSSLSTVSYFHRPGMQSSKMASKDAFKNILGTLSGQPQRRPQLFFVIGPEYSGAEIVCTKLKEEFPALAEIVTEDTIDTDLSARLALLRSFPATTKEWDTFRDTSKYEKERLWTESKSLVIKVVSDKGPVMKKWEESNKGKNQVAREQA
jgi:hypothetical protein